MNSLFECAVQKLGKSLCKACHPYAGSMLIFSVSFQIDHILSKGRLPAADPTAPEDF
jgi:hypothetical protein